MGLPACAENKLRGVSGLKVLSKLARLCQAEHPDDAEDDTSDPEPFLSSTTLSSAQLVKKVKAWQELLPSVDAFSAAILDRNVDAIVSPLDRWIVEQKTTGAKLLETIRSDLEEAR